ncbi:hypothetical protein ACFW34_11930 [Streptomyces sp. NPDC058848]|uniref:hypothetical protein n=1 Tax=unclassified Streptomyces TaxID=2593676 RepID=UPI00368F9FAE
MTGPACGNNPHFQMSDGDRQAVDSFRAYLTARAALQRIRTVLETEAVVGRTALEYRGLITAALMADETATTETQALPVQHAPGKAIRCPDCRDKGYAVCQDEPAVTVHACPGPEDNGVSPCCKRPPFEFRGERLTRDPNKVTCTGGAAGARQDGADHTCNSIVARGEMDEPLGYLICGICGTPKNGARP